MTKILVPIFSNLAFSGGVGEITRMLAKHAAESGFTMVDMGDTDISGGYPVNKPSVALKLRRKSSHLARFLFFGRLAPRADIVFFQTSMSRSAFTRDVLYMKQCTRQQRPYAVFIHGWNQPWVDTIDRFRWSGTAAECLTRARAVFVLASVFKNKLVAWGVPAYKIHVITTMVDEDLLAHFDLASKLANLRAGSAQKILFMSRVVKQKGIYEVVDAFALHSAAHPEATLTIAGDGPELERLQRYVRNLGIPGVHFTGYVSGAAKARVLQEANVLLLPTYHGEGLPVAVLEAAAFGCALVTRPVAGLADFVTEEMGFLTESLQPEVFARFLETLCDRDLLERIAVHNHAHAARSVTGSAVSRRIFDLIAAAQ